MPDVAGLVNDPDFQALPPDRRKAILDKIGAASAPYEQVEVTPTGSEVGQTLSGFRKGLLPVEDLAAMALNTAKEHPLEPLGITLPLRMVAGTQQGMQKHGRELLGEDDIGLGPLDPILETLLGAFAGVAEPAGRLAALKGSPEELGRDAGMMTAMLAPGLRGVRNPLRGGRAAVAAEEGAQQLRLPFGDEPPIRPTAPPPEPPPVAPGGPAAPGGAAPTAGGAAAGESSAVMDLIKAVLPESESVAWELAGRKLGQVTGVPGAVLYGGRLGRLLQKLAGRGKGAGPKSAQAMRGTAHPVAAAEDVTTTTARALPEGLSEADLTALAKTLGVSEDEALNIISRPGAKAAPKGSRPAPTAPTPEKISSGEWKGNVRTISDGSQRYRLESPGGSFSGTVTDDTVTLGTINAPKLGDSAVTAMRDIAKQQGKQKIIFTSKPGAGAEGLGGVSGKAQKWRQRLIDSGDARLLEDGTLEVSLEPGGFKIGGGEPPPTPTPVPAPKPPKSPAPPTAATPETPASPGRRGFLGKLMKGAAGAAVTPGKTAASAAPAAASTAAANVNKYLSVLKAVKAKVGDFNPGVLMEGARDLGGVSGGVGATPEVAAALEAELAKAGMSPKIFRDMRNLVQEWGQARNLEPILGQDAAVTSAVRDTADLMRSMSKVTSAKSYAQSQATWVDKALGSRDPAVRGVAESIVRGDYAGAAKAIPKNLENLSKAASEHMRNLRNITESASASESTAGIISKEVKKLARGAKVLEEAPTSPKPASPKPPKKPTPLSKESVAEKFTKTKTDKQTPPAEDFLPTDTGPTGRPRLPVRPGPEKIKRTPVESSAFRSYGYDAKSKILEVEHIDGAVYRYHDVPPMEIPKIRAAKSKGRVIGEVTKKYPGTRQGTTGKAELPPLTEKSTPAQRLDHIIHGDETRMAYEGTTAEIQKLAARAKRGKVPHKVEDLGEGRSRIVATKEAEAPAPKNASGGEATATFRGKEYRVGDKLPDGREVLAIDNGIPTFSKSLKPKPGPKGKSYGDKS